TWAGILPSNEGRGFVLRRLLRRAARHGRLLGIQGLFLAKLAQTVIAESKDGYPELEEKKEYILKVLTNEEEKFNKTIDQGILILSDLEEKLAAAGGSVLSGEDAFRLYDTYGFPIDLTQEILAERGFTVDMDGFGRAMDVQKSTARDARAVTNYMGADATVYDEIDVSITSSFVGYDRLSAESRISVMTTEKELVTELVAGESGTIIVDETPFYATMGGQAGDTGVICRDGARFEVGDTIKLKGGRIAHVGTVTEGMFRTGDTVTLTVDAGRRSATCKNHSATHLLQEALRQVLGTHVEQAGSLVTPERLRFDFTHFSATTAEELARTEALVNEKIAERLAVVTQVLKLEEAKKTGAKALFGEKYGETVRVVGMGEFSKEFCGGTHVGNTGDITAFRILSESGVAAGVRRIEAITADNVFAYYRQVEDELNAAAKAAKAEPAALAKKIEAMQEELKQLHAENERLAAKLANNSLGDVMSQVKEIGGLKVLAAKVPEVDMNGLRNLGDQLKEKLGEGVVFLASAQGGKVSLVAMATEGAIKQGAHAGNLIREAAALVGGGGGGRPNMAQAGGRNPEGIDAAIAKVYEILS
ncbi:MAG: alanine--tRNA ligase, partial [Lachnospiraceae bacterium]|nr:alanine--tRNA ligase [Lachnospiraceae bacterium]